jgi:hypothetical protein
MRRSTLAVLALATILLAAPAALARDDGADGRSGDPFTYAVIGDTPYGQPQIDNFPNDVAEINAARDVRLVIHLGDIKNGSTRCDTTYFQLIRSDFDRFADPLVYTPGDNEWTDCHRSNNGGYLPTERLDTLRRTFFDKPGRSLGDRSQELDAAAAPYVENVRWSRSDVQFATLNVPGSNDDWLPWFGAATRTQAQIDEYQHRNAADVAWLDHVFDTAKRRGARAVVLGIQADMWDPAFSGANDDPAQYDHFTDFVRALAAQSLAFSRPVLLLNGDSHSFVDDRPLAADAPAYRRAMYGVTKPVANLRRITVNGSTTPCHEWLRLRVDPGTRGVFSYKRAPFHNQPGFDPAVCPGT